MLVWNAEVSRQQSDVMQEKSDDMAKIMEVARRIGKGAKVPASDEKKLMEFNMDIYKMAKNMAAINMNRKHEEWDSLWGEEEEKEYEDPREVSENAEANVELPEGMEAMAGGEASSG